MTNGGKAREGHSIESANVLSGMSVGSHNNGISQSKSPTMQKAGSSYKPFENDATKLSIGGSNVPTGGRTGKNTKHIKGVVSNNYI